MDTPAKMIHANTYQCRWSQAASMRPGWSQWDLSAFLWRTHSRRKTQQAGNRLPCRCQGSASGITQLCMWLPHYTFPKFWQMYCKE